MDPEADFTSDHDFGTVSASSSGNNTEQHQTSVVCGTQLPRLSERTRETASRMRQSEFSVIAARDLRATLTKASHWSIRFVHYETLASVRPTKLRKCSEILGVHAGVNRGWCRLQGLLLPCRTRRGLHRTRGNRGTFRRACVRGTNRRQHRLDLFGFAFCEMLRDEAVPCSGVDVVEERTGSSVLLSMAAAGGGA